MEEDQILVQITIIIWATFSKISGHHKTWTIWTSNSVCTAIRIREEAIKHQRSFQEFMVITHIVKLGTVEVQDTKLKKIRLLVQIVEMIYSRDLTNIRRGTSVEIAGILLLWIISRLEHSIFMDRLHQEMLMATMQIV